MLTEGTLSVVMFDYYCHLLFVRVPKETRNPPSANPVVGGKLQPYIETKLVCVCVCLSVCVCVVLCCQLTYVTRFAKTQNNPANQYFQYKPL